MKPRNCLIFGASGQIGRNLVRSLTKKNLKVTAVTRNQHQKGYILKTQANPGYLELVEIKNFNPDKIEELMKRCSICINLIGILFEKKKDHFKNIHTDLPNLISQVANRLNLEKFIHLSALGIDEASDSLYAKSKLEGEKKIIGNFNNSIILRPSIVYSVDDNFTTRFMKLLSILPVMPIYYNGNTRFSPIHVSDIVNIIYDMIENKKRGLILECVGSEILSFKDMIKILLNSINKKRLIIPLPIPIAKISAKILQLLPQPLLTEDQLKLLKYDNIKTGKYKNNIDLGLEAKKKFRDEIEKYSFNWRTGGQFSKINDEIKIK